MGCYFIVTSVFKVFECLQDLSYVCATCDHSESWEMVCCLLQFSKSVVYCLWLDPCMCSSGPSTGVHKQLCWVTFLSSVIFLVLLFPLISLFLGLWPKSWDFIYLSLSCTPLKCTHVLSQGAEKQRKKTQSFIPTLLDHIASQWRSFLLFFRILHDYMSLFLPLPRHAGGHLSYSSNIN